MKRRWRAVAVATPLLGAVATAACASTCSNTTDADAGSDAPSDLREASVEQGVDTCDAGPDASALSDWPGFRRLNELSPCCVVDVALDASASIPALEWTACSNGAPSCAEVKRTWQVSSPPSYFGLGKVSHDSAGAPQLMPLGFPLSGTSGMTGIYAIPSLSIVAGFRADSGNTGTASAHCPFSELAAGASTALLARPGTGGPIVGAVGPTSTITTPSFNVLAAPGTIPGFQTSFASPSRLAFDVQPSGLIGQWPFDAGAFVMSKNATGAALLLDFIEGDDVYAWSVHGDAGWMQEYRVKADGSVTLFRGKDTTQITAMATDGLTLAWCESYGSTTPSEQQPNVELWAAPYTNDATVLSTTAKKVATLPFGYACGGVPVLFQGYYAVTTVPFSTAIVVRLVDGASQQISAGAGWGFGVFAFVTPTELWSTMNVVNDAGGGLRGIAFAKYTLGAWP